MRGLIFAAGGSDIVLNPTHWLRGIADALCYTAVKQVLDGTISEKGILAPLNPKINNPLMKELKEKYGYVHQS